MTQSVHSYIRRRGARVGDAVDLNYLATGRHLQEDLRALGERGLPKPDLLRGILRCASLDQATEAVAAKLNGLYTREVEVEDGDNFYVEHPQFVGPPRIRLRAPRLPRPKASIDAAEKPEPSGQPERRSQA